VTMSYKREAKLKKRRKVRTALSWLSVFLSAAGFGRRVFLEKVEPDSFS